MPRVLMGCLCLQRRWGPRAGLCLCDPRGWGRGRGPRVARCSRQSVSQQGRAGQKQMGAAPSTSASTPAPSEQTGQCFIKLSVRGHPGPPLQILHPKKRRKKSVSYTWLNISRLCSCWGLDPAMQRTDAAGKITM